MMQVFVTISLFNFKIRFIMTRFSLETTIVGESALKM